MEIALGRVISGAREISSDALIEHAACAATGLAELGVGAGDAIGMVLRNDFPFFEASYAAQRLGATASRSTGTAKPRRSPMC